MEPVPGNYYCPIGLLFYIHSIIAALSTWERVHCAMPFASVLITHISWSPWALLHPNPLNGESGEYILHQ
jgi:hypothetical protein